VAGLAPRLKGAADLLCRYKYECWSYGDSIGFEGLLAASQVLSDNRYAGYVHGSLKGWMARKDPFNPWDNTAPGHAMCLSYEDTGDETILAAALELADYLRLRPKVHGAYAAFERAPLRQPYSGEVLSPRDLSLLADPGRGVFVDCLHFDPPFFVHLGALTGDTSLVDDGVAQALAMVALLQDPRTGMFAHFFLERTSSTYALGWSRGQGWALLGLLDVLTYAPVSHPGYREVLESAVRLAEALASTQDPSGLWHAVIGRDDFYLETSVAFFFALGLWRGISRGWFRGELSQTADRAWKAGLELVSESGSMSGVSAAVWASTVESHYGNVPIGFQVPWGQGSLLLAAEARAQAFSSSGLEEPE
jgi:unsaturated rhamnogalacturonyl hydrolase